MQVRTKQPRIIQLTRRFVVTFLSFSDYVLHQHRAAGEVAKKQRRYERFAATSLLSLWQAYSTLGRTCLFHTSGGLAFSILQAA